MAVFLTVIQLKLFIKKELGEWHKSEKDRYQKHFTPMWTIKKQRNKHSEHSILIAEWKSWGHRRDRGIQSTELSSSNGECGMATNCRDAAFLTGGGEYYILYSTLFYIAL